MKLVLARVVVGLVSVMAGVLVAGMFTVAVVTVWQFSPQAVLLPLAVVLACALWVWGMTVLLEAKRDRG